MQSPPPGPPPGPPAQPVASSGIDKRTGSTLAYLVIWLTGIVFLFVGKHDPDIKFNAAQSVVLFGSLQVLAILVNIVGSFVPFFGLLGVLIWLVEIVLWIFCLFSAWTSGGARVQVPVVGGVIAPYAEQLAAAVN